MGAAGGAWSHGRRFTDLAHACQSWWSISGNHCDDLRPLPRAVMYLTLAYHARGRTSTGARFRRSGRVRTRPGDRSDRDAGGSGRRGRALRCLGPGRRALAARGRYGHCTWARRLRNGHSLGHSNKQKLGPNLAAAAKTCAAAAQRTEACPCTLILTTRMQHACIRLDAHAQLTF